MTTLLGNFPLNQLHNIVLSVFCSGTSVSTEAQQYEQTSLINGVRHEVEKWRALPNPNTWQVTPETARLLQHWRHHPFNSIRPFFCQIEALETVIFLTEVAPASEPWILNELKEANDSSNPGLGRLAMKMATGSGKTVVMCMLIAYNFFNKKANKQDGRFSDAFLVIAPGITIRDRLRVLFPNDEDNYYRKRDLVPSDLMPQLAEARIVITNFHSFLARDKMEASKLAKDILGGGAGLVESPQQVVTRVCRELGGKGDIIVINDEAHHCYRRRKETEEEKQEKLDREEKGEAKRRDEDARVWISGIEAVAKKKGVRAIYDLSATPFFLKGSGWNEGTLFPWVISDFSLIDAIEAGIVKIPRVPIADNSVDSGGPTYRNIWYHIKDHLPKKGRADTILAGEPKLPKVLEGALHSLYSNYEKHFKRWQEDAGASKAGRTPPVFIVVCNNTAVSKLVFDYISGWEKEVGGKQVVQAGQMDLFRNDDTRGGWLARPNTILVDSEQLESGEGMGSDFKKYAAREIEEFKQEYRQRFPGRDVDSLTDEDLLREVMNTVGKEGKLGGEVRCVVSVSMLTEGWDAQTVTHVLGVRAFGTQLLCEQVVGRALRRTSYAVDENGMFTPEYAEVYGVPFSFIPTSGTTAATNPPVKVTRIKAVEGRETLEITFPRIAGYRHEVPGEKLRYAFGKESNMTLSTKDLPTSVENAPIVGEASVHTLDDLRMKRLNEIAFFLAHKTLKRFRDDDGNEKPWLFPQVLEITRRWIEECVSYKDDTYPQLLYLVEWSNVASEKIFLSIAQETNGLAGMHILPLIEPYDPMGSSKVINFDTRRPCYETRADKCQINYVAADTNSYEQKTAMVLEELDFVLRYVKNDHMGFFVPYTYQGAEHNYIPDFVAVVDDGHGVDDPLNLIIEVTGQRDTDKEAKVSTARELWVPAVNNCKRFGRWAFFEITDPWNAKFRITEFVKKQGAQ
ncbi:MAG: DEAD/DEAH box helicase family protein [Methanomassiliicoccales archaeon]